MELNGKVVLIIHATNDLGRALAIALAQEGAALVLAGNDAAALDELVKHLTSGQHTVVAADINSEAGRFQVIEACRDRPIDIFINNAGSGGVGLFRTTPQNEIAEFIHNTLTAPLLLTRALTPQLTERKAAMIVNIGTLSSNIGLPGLTMASCIGFGMRGFSEALARELVNTSINTIYVAHRGLTREKGHSSPAPAPNLNTPLTQHSDDPARAAKAIIRAIRKDARSSQLGWAARWWVLRNTLAPKKVDKALLKHLPAFVNFARKKSLSDG